MQVFYQFISGDIMKIKKVGKIENGNKLDKISIVPCCGMADYELAICAYPRLN